MPPPYLYQIINFQGEVICGLGFGWLKPKSLTHIHGNSKANPPRIEIVLGSGAFPLGG